LIHGFNVGDGGRSTVGTLAPFFVERGVTPIVVNYGHFGLLQTKFFNPRVAKKVADAVRAANLYYDYVYVVGHSNGCAIADLASREEGFHCEGFSYINPALRRDQPLQSSVGRLDVWHSPSDLPVKVAKLLPFRGSWGAMGSTGYQGGGDQRIRNFNKEEDYSVESSSHSDVFDLDKRPFFGPLIVDNLLRGLA
jgi:hypothetical protein